MVLKLEFVVCLEIGKLIEMQLAIKHDKAVFDFCSWESSILITTLFNFLK